MSPRLTLALAEGAFALPDGPVAVIHPRADAELSALPRDHVRIVQPFRPDHDAWARLGYDTAGEPGESAAVSVLFLPRAKAAARDLVARAMAATTDLVVVDGQKTDGIESILKDIRRRVAVSGVISKAHGKLFWMAPSAGFSDWIAGAHTMDGFTTAPGVFSADGIDPASRLLADTLPASVGRSVADLGAGWGYLARRILERTDVTELHLVEADRIALDCARLNLPDPRARFHWADATDWTAPGRIDSVVMNPPFHTGRAADPGLGRAFIASAARILTPSGNLWMVANRHLPYEAHLAMHFVRVDEVAGTPQFKILHASRPSRARR